MIIGIFGESCAGKSTLAERISEELSAKTFTGKDYLRMDKNEEKAKALFMSFLKEESDYHVIYVISELEHLELLPDNAFRILVTAELETIKNRFAQRMKGHLPDPVAKMLERKHGQFDGLYHDHHIHEGAVNLQQLLDLMKMHEE